LAFFEEAKCLLGSSNLTSRIENIEGSHYFVRFDRSIKLKKKEFDDPQLHEKCGQDEERTVEHPRHHEGKYEHAR
jgi:hypothetical protein